MLFAMHIPDGFLSLPVSLAAAAIAVLGVSGSIRRLQSSIGDRLVPLVGVTAAAIFAGQMVNFPLIGLPASGHLLGGVLAAALLGPWGGVVAITAVLIVQCLMFADGGLIALGANIINMALIGSGIGYVLFNTLRRLIGGARGIVVAAVIASWLSVAISALAFSVELSAGGEFDFVTVVAPMLLYHSVIGLGEAIITGLVIAWIARVRPELIYGQATIPVGSSRLRQAAAIGLTAALALAIFAAPWANELDDGLETVASQLGFADRAVETLPAPLPDYSWPWVADWFTTSALATSCVGLLGTTITCAFAWGVARTAVRPRAEVVCREVLLQK